MSLVKCPGCKKMVRPDAPACEDNPPRMFGRCSMNYYEAKVIAERPYRLPDYLLQVITMEGVDEKKFLEATDALIADAENRAAGMLLSELRKRGINTDNWDGDEGLWPTLARNIAQAIQEENAIAYAEGRDPSTFPPK